jgi:hypothetical protein
VLIALLGEPAGHAADVLAALGVDRGQARRRAVALVATAAGGSGVGGRKPIDLRAATDMIVMTGGRDPREPGETHKQLLGDGLVHVDYGEPGQVFLVRVTRVPRVPLLDEARPLGFLDDGVAAWLIGVSVDNFVTVMLEGRGAAAESALQRYRDEQADREQAAGARPDTSPPVWPAERLLAVSLTLSDDAGTKYQIEGAQTGGDGREWVHVWHYRPTPPPEATTVRLAAQVGSSLTAHDLPLAANNP